MRHVVLNDVTTSVSLAQQNLSVVSKAWSLLLGNLGEKLRFKDYRGTLEILKCSSWLDFQMARLKLDGFFYGAEVEGIASTLVGELDSKSNTNSAIIFENLNALCRHREIRNVELHDILLQALPRFSLSSTSHNVRQQIVTAAKTQVTEIQVMCLETICRFGSVEKRLPLIKACVSSDDVDLAVASVRNLMFAIGDGKSYSISTVVDTLILATTSAGDKLRLAVSKHMGGIVCLLSGRAVLIRFSISPFRSTLSPFAGCLKRLFLPGRRTKRPTG